MCSFILSNILTSSLQLGGKGGLLAEWRKHSRAIFTFQPEGVVSGRGYEANTGAVRGADLEGIIVCQMVPSSPNDSRLVGTLLLEGSKMTEVLLLERR